MLWLSDFDIHYVQCADCCSSLLLAGLVVRCCVGGGGGGGEGISRWWWWVYIRCRGVERLCIRVNGYFKVCQGLEIFKRSGHNFYLLLTYRCWLGLGCCCHSRRLVMLIAAHHFPTVSRHGLNGCCWLSAAAHWRRLWLLIVVKHFFFLYTAHKLSVLCCVYRIYNAERHGLGDNTSREYIWCARVLNMFVLGW